MAKVIDITEKLDLSGNPAIAIAGKEFEVKGDAATWLKITGLFSNPEGGDGEKTEKAIRLMFSTKDADELLSLIPMKNLPVVIQTAQSLIMGGNEDSEGEGQTHTTT